MINVKQEQVFLGVPSIDRRIDVHCMLGIMHCLQYIGATSFMIGNSNISHVRNLMAHMFMEKSPCEWFQMVDSDIVFTRADWEILWEGNEDLVTAPYARKVIGEKPAEFGLGFTRVHRSVFEKIQKLTQDDGSEYAGRFMHKGELVTNYFPNGPSGTRWLAEDHGFFTLARMADVTYRLEKRTRLHHVGYFEFGYPEQIAGYKVFDGDTLKNVSIELAAGVDAGLEPMQIETKSGETQKEAWPDFPWPGSTKSLT